MLVFDEQEGEMGYSQEWGKRRSMGLGGTVARAAAVGEK